VAVLAASLLSFAAQTPQAPNIEALTREVQGKGPGEVRALIVGRLGPPARDIGSGLSIEQWDVDGGVLTFHPLRGPTFEKGGLRTRLIRTTNRAAVCLFGSYQMSTLPEGPHGNTRWLGQVSLSADSTYRYTRGHQDLEPRDRQSDNFFMLHPNGSAQVKYASGVGPESRLEDLPDGSPVATVTFVAGDRRFSKAYRIVAYRTSMFLVFEGEAIPFRLQRAWVQYWR
jgi:hypothetical protein